MSRYALAACNSATHTFRLYDTFEEMLGTLAEALVKDYLLLDENVTTFNILKEIIESNKKTPKRYKNFAFIDMYNRDERCIPFEWIELTSSVLYPEGVMKYNIHTDCDIIHRDLYDNGASSELLSWIPPYRGSGFEYVNNVPYKAMIGAAIAFHKECERLSNNSDII